jgi:carboxyl-terminal processing protease
VIGTQTYGKGSVQSVIPLSDNSGLRLTTAKYFTPDGESIHEKGITPDIVIPLETASRVTDEEPQQQEGLEDVDEESQQEEFSEDQENQSPDENSDTEVEEILKRDQQLQRAVDVLRGILIFEKQSV